MELTASERGVSDLAPLFFPVNSLASDGLIGKARATALLLTSDGCPAICGHVPAVVATVPDSPSVEDFSARIRQDLLQTLALVSWAMAWWFLSSIECDGFIWIDGVDPLSPPGFDRSFWTAGATALDSKDERLLSMNRPAEAPHVNDKRVSDAGDDRRRELKRR